MKNQRVSRILRALFVFSLRSITKQFYLGDRKRTTRDKGKIHAALSLYRGLSGD